MFKYKIEEIKKKGQNFRERGWWNKASSYKCSSFNEIAEKGKIKPIGIWDFYGNQRNWPMDDVLHKEHSWLVSGEGERLDGETRVTRYIRSQD